MAHDQQVRLHGVQGHGRVDQGLALGHRRGAGSHVHRVGAQPLGRQLEARLGAGGRLEEEVHERRAAEQPELLVALAVQRHEAVGEVEKRVGGGPVQPVHAQEVRLGEGEEARLDRGFDPAVAAGSRLGHGPRL